MRGLMGKDRIEWKSNRTDRPPVELPSRKNGSGADGLERMQGVRGREASSAGVFSCVRRFSIEQAS